MGTSITGGYTLENIKLSFNQDKVIKYLNKSRFIGYDVIKHLIDNKLLLQEEDTNNAIFPMYDEKNNYVGAEVQGILEIKRFKGIKPGSKYGYGFNLRFSDNGEFDYALFFESAIDLMSFVDFKIHHEGKTLTRCILVSMAGLKPNVLKHTLKAFKRQLKPVLCIDNDETGAAFMKALETEKIPFITRLPDEQYKDWNDQIAAHRKGNKPFSRLIEGHNLAAIIGK